MRQTLLASLLTTTLLMNGAPLCAAKHKEKNSTNAQSTTASTTATIKESKTTTTASKTTEESATKTTATNTPTISPFTGKVVSNKVRLRLQPNLDGHIVRQMAKDELAIVINEEEDFYVVKAPTNMKAYVFRTFVLDNVIEGDRVNVRLEPSLESPVIAQLNTGDKVNGKVCESNSKWVEISPPEATKLYIAKEYIEQVGDIDYFTKTQQRRDAATRELNNAYVMSQSELNRPFEEINPQTITTSFQKVCNDFNDCEEVSRRAAELEELFLQAYTQKKVAFLESKTQNSSTLTTWEQKNEELNTQIESYQVRLTELENLLKEERGFKLLPEEPGTSSLATTPAYDKHTYALSVWEPLEINRYEEWAKEREMGTIQDFYAEEQINGTELTGIVEPYTRPIKNKPGDFLLLDRETKAPVAYLYSTAVNLYEHSGKEIKVIAAPRPNNNFAYPAYNALTIE